MAKSKKQKQAAEEADFKLICRNRRARHEYEILDELECGIELLGSEVKSIRDSKISIEEAYARVRDGELWLVGADIAEYPQANVQNHLPKRTRKLLVHKRELRKFAESAAEQGLTLVPLAVYFRRGRVKVTLALARGRKRHDKRERLKKEAHQKEMRQAMMRNK